MNSILVDRRKGSRDVCIAFSARDTAAGKFTFFNVVKDLPAHIIFINDYANNWYLNGTPEFPTREAFVAHVRRLVDELRGPGGRLFTLGSSMGSYAALNYGAELQADRIFALGPESELCIPLGRSVTSMLRHQEGDEDISRLTYKDPRHVLIISGSNDIVDMYCASRFKLGNPLMNVCLVTNRTHVVAKYLDGNFGLARLVRQYFTDEDDSFLQDCELSPVPDLATATALKRFNEAFQVRKEVLLDDAELIRAVSDAVPSWSMPPYFYGLIAEARGQLAVAEDYLQRAVTAQRSLGRAVLKLARLRHQDGRHQQAVDGLLDLASTNNTWSVTELLSQCYQSLGQPLEAIQVLRAFDRALLKPPEEVRLEKRLAELATRYFQMPVAAPAVRRRLTDAAAVAAAGRVGSNLVLRSSAVELDGSAHLELGADVTLDGAELRLGADATLRVGRGCLLRGRIVVGAGGTLVLGDDVVALEPLQIDAAGGAAISIGAGSRLQGTTIRSSHPWQLTDRTTGTAIATSADVRLGERVWLGDRVIVLPGSVLGDGTVVEAGAVVSLQVPEGRCLVAGAPAQVVRRQVDWSVMAAGGWPAPAELVPATVAAHAADPAWLLARALPWLSQYRRIERADAWLVPAVVDAALRLDEPPADPGLLLSALRHCNDLVQRGERDWLLAEERLLRRLQRTAEADVLAWLILSRWPK